MQRYSSAQRVWEAALGRLQLQVTRPSFDTWLKETTGLSMEDHHLVVGVPTIFTAEWLEKRMFQLIEKAVEAVARQPLEVSFQVSRPSSEGSFQPDQPSTNGKTPPYRERVTTAPATCLNPRYTFGSFIGGPSNQLALAAARAVAEQPGRAYNPLFLYAGSGLGKTHLLQAIAHHVDGAGLAFRYVSSEQFTNDFISAIRDRRTSEFRDSYRAVDILLIDDIQFITGKEQTQEGFFHTFNALHNNDCQIVISCDRPPSALPLLEKRLRSRFEGGLIADIQPPELETRLAILESKARQLSTPVPEQVLRLIAHRARANVRELEGLLNQTVALADFSGVPVTPELATRALGLAQETLPDSSLSAEQVIALVADHFRISASALTNSKRDAKTTTARQLAMYLLRKEFQFTLQQIGAAFRGRNHATVLHTLRTVEQRLQADEELALAHQLLRSQLLPDPLHITPQSPTPGSAPSRRHSAFSPPSSKGRATWPMRKASAPSA